MQDFLHTGMLMKQHDYYVHMGTKKQSITWGTNPYNKLIEATHSLWTKRNSFDHDRQIHGLREVEDIRLKSAKRININQGWQV